MSPGDIESESPPRAAPESAGRPQSGPGMRGNSTKITTISGRACSTSAPAMRRLVRSGSTVPG